MRKWLIAECNLTLWLNSCSRICGPYCTGWQHFTLTGPHPLKLDVQRTVSQNCSSGLKRDTPLQPRNVDQIRNNRRLRPVQVMASVRGRPVLGEKRLNELLAVIKNSSQVICDLQSMNQPS